MKEQESLPTTRWSSENVLFARGEHWRELESVGEKRKNRIAYIVVCATHEIVQGNHENNTEQAPSSAACLLLHGPVGISTIETC
mmetsp:Transcript_26157/g.67454  ORF Transcript_26157/g.67454 Transcript_26157/m.67454 type:complete len:84 (-) Transcript_26157:473-724(-)|eukprot:965573-Pelagomonas_calceolata.AAC.12